jgi:hypothetical protein
MADPSFATTEQYEQMIKGTAPENTQAVLDAASAQIRRYCGWHIAPIHVDEVMVLDGPGGPDLMLPTLNLIGVIEAVERVTWTADATVIPATDLDWSRIGTIRKQGRGHWTPRLRGLTVTATHGYEMTDVPDLTQLVLTSAARTLGNPYGVTQQAVGGVSISMPAGATAAGGGGVIPLEGDQLLALDVYRLERRP